MSAFDGHIDAANETAADTSIVEFVDNHYVEPQYTIEETQVADSGDQQYVLVEYQGTTRPFLLQGGLNQFVHADVSYSIP